MLRVRSLLTGVPGSPFYSNLFFEGTLSSDAQAAADAVGAFWATVGQLMAPPLVINVDPFVPNITPLGGEIIGGFTITPPVTVGGTGAGVALPAATQMLAQLLTGAYAGGRAIRGKFNLPWVTEEHNVGNGTPSENGRALLQSAFEDLIAAGPALQVWSRKNGNAADVTDVTISPKFAVLRSRRD